LTVLKPPVLSISWSGVRKTVIEKKKTMVKMND